MEVIEQEKTFIELKKVDSDKRLLELRRYAESIMATVTGFVIANDEDEKTAGKILREIRENVKAAVSLKKGFTEPNKLWIKMVEDKFKLVTNPLESADSIVSSSLQKYDQTKALKAKADEKKVIAKIAKGTISEEKAVEKLADIKAPEKTIVADDGVKITYRTDLVVEITNEQKLPAQYWMPNIKMIETLAKANHKAGMKQIEGVTVHEVRTPVTGRAY